MISANLDRTIRSRLADGELVIAYHDEVDGDDQRDLDELRAIATRYGVVFEWDDDGDGLDASGGVDDDAIAALGEEAAIGGDTTQAELCRRAIGGDSEARAECVETIREADRRAAE